MKDPIKQKIIFNQDKKNMHYLKFEKYLF